MIDPDEAKRIEKNLILRDIYYRPTGYYSNAKSLLKALKVSDACKKEGHWFRLKDVKDWLGHQQSYQIYMPPPKHIPRVSYGKIIWPNCVHQCDIMFLTHDHYRGKTYKAVLNIIDCAFWYKASVPLTSKNAHEVAKAFRKKYGDRNNPLIWPELL